MWKIFAFGEESRLALWEPPSAEKSGVGSSTTQVSRLPVARSATSQSEATPGA